MTEVWPRFFQALRLQRESFVWMEFNDRATGDALMFVVGTRVLIFLGFNGLGLISMSFLEALFFTVLGGVIFWLWFSGLSYLIAHHFFEGDINFATTMRISGFAYPTLIVSIGAAAILANAVLAFIVGIVWFLAISARGIHVTSDIGNDKAWISVVGAVLGYFAIRAIFAGIFSGLPL